MSKESIISARLRKLMNALGFTRQKQFALVAELSPAYLNQLLSGKKENLSERLVSQISENLGVSAEWLRTGNGAMFEEVRSHKPSSVTFPVMLFNLTKAAEGSGRSDRFRPNLVESVKLSVELVRNMGLPQGDLGKLFFFRAKAGEIVAPFKKGQLLILKELDGEEELSEDVCLVQHELNLSLVPVKRADGQVYIQQKGIFQKLKKGKYHKVFGKVVMAFQPVGN